jgi:hypothetical protein
MIKKPAAIVGEIDYKASQAIENGNGNLSSKDRLYCSQIKRDVDYGMDL